MRKFECYICGEEFAIVGEPLFHYDQSEDLSEDEVVSVCDDCSLKCQSLAIERGITKKFNPRFFNPE